MACRKFSGIGQCEFFGLAIAKANVIGPSGNMNLGGQYPIVPVNAVVKSIKDLEGVSLRPTPAGAVFGRDLATVDDPSDIVTSEALVTGRRTVDLPVTKRADASTLAGFKLVKKNLTKFKAAAPVGVLGGFTTFSSFSFQTLSLLDDGQWARAPANLSLSFALGMLAVWLGHIAAQALGQR